MKGKPNATTQYLKDCILLAAEAEGMDGKGKEGLIGYLRMLARTQPKSYSTLLARVMPTQINHAIQEVG